VPSRRLIVAIAIVVVLSVITPGAGLAAVPSPSATPVQNGLVIPWDLAFSPDGRMFVTERPGRVRVYANGRPGAALLATTTIGGVRAQGEAGLMGIEVDHLFEQNRLIYVCASRMHNGEWLNQVLRYRVRANWTLVFDRWIIRTGMRANTIHNGCAVEEGPDHKIWVSMGDANESWRAQSTSRLNGKILRVNRDGTIPSDNPVWPGHSGPSRVYSIGHRNPQGIAFQPGTGRVYAVEHGPDRDDEINWIRSGRNYGWPCVTGSNNSFLPGTPGCPGGTSAFSQPVWSTEGPTLATSNGAFLRNRSKWGSWTGHLMVSTLKQQDLRRFSIDSSGKPATLRQTLFNGSWGRLRATVIGPGYQLYVTTSNGSNDRVIRITP
jgi:glucose/arabinose dehydrogenase